MVTKEQLEKIRGWHYMSNNKTDDMFPVSGWKLHIFGTDIHDSFTIASVIESIVYQYNMHMKVATLSVMLAGIGNPAHPQFGKCVVIYLTPDMFKKEGRLKQFVGDLQSALSSAKYTKKGFIVGDKSIDETIFYRYELSKPIDIQKGVDFFEYAKLYERNRHIFNIPDNPDIESYLNS